MQKNKHINKDAETPNTITLNISDTSHVSNNHKFERRDESEENDLTLMALAILSKRLKLQEFKKSAEENMNGK